MRRLSFRFQIRPDVIEQVVLQIQGVGDSVGVDKIVRASLAARPDPCVLQVLVDRGGDAGREVDVARAAGDSAGIGPFDMFGND